MHLQKRARARTHTHTHTRISVIVFESRTAEKDRGEANWIKVSVVFLSHSPKCSTERSVEFAVHDCDNALPVPADVTVFRSTTSTRNNRQLTSFYLRITTR